MKIKINVQHNTKSSKKQNNNKTECITMLSRVGLRGESKV